jgi:MFS family permease
MDHAGAVLGPLLATLFLLAYPGRYRTLFLLTIVPGALAVLMFFMVQEVRPSRRAPPSGAHNPESEPADAAWRRLPGRFYVFLFVLLLFALGNSADAFLLLRLTDLGVRPEFIPLLWAAHHVVKAGVSVLGGVRSDRLGRRRVIGTGWIVYALVYAGFALTTSAASLIGLFLVYGFYYGFAEGTEKALIADLAPAELRGTAFGLYYAVLGIGGLLASVVFGLIWRAAGAAAAFSAGAALAVVATLLLFSFVRDERVA